MSDTPLQHIRVLLCEDSEDDAGLLDLALKRGGYQARIQLVDNERDFLDALQGGSWDIIITDHSMPSFNSGDVIRLANEWDPHLPVIIVSGSIGEEAAVEAMKSGAQDYVMKGNLKRLVPAIEREIKEAQTRREHQQAQDLIHHMAYHDSLTGLVNRREFESRLRNALQSRSPDDSYPHALLYIDLDRFKLVNDSCGHMAGDELLRRLSRKLLRCMRDNDTLARLGGDEFGVLLEHCPLERARHIAQHILDTVDEYVFVWGDRHFKVGASIGLVISDGVEDEQTLLSLADMACYTAKDLGRHRVHVAAPGDREITQRRGEIEWVQRLRHAMDHDRLMLYAQRIEPLGDGVAHHELLLRMQDEDGSVITPDRFIPAAERYNLMLDLDRWVISRTFELLQTLSPDGTDSYFINLSGISLSCESLVDHIRDQQELYGIAPARIGFEITETAAIANFDAAIDIMTRLQATGFRIAIDDFGTGMSSFSYLRSLPADYIKIDGSFVRDMLDDDIGLAIVESVNRIAHIAGLRTIAEYVENDALFERLRQMGVDYAQGWAIQRPQPLQAPRQSLAV